MNAHIKIAKHEDGTASIKIDGHYAHGRDPQMQGGKYRKPYELHRATPAQVDRLISWMFAVPGRLGSYGNGQYQICLDTV
jgi:hypothetical protein